MITSTFAQSDEHANQASYQKNATRWPLKKISQSEAFPECLDDDLRRAEDLALDALESNLGEAAFQQVATQIRA